MKIVLAGGGGQIGRILIRHFTAKEDECVVLSRRAAGHMFTSAVRVVEWDGRNLGAWTGEVEGADVLINLAGRSVDCRYNKRNMAKMFSSRIESTRVIGTAIANAKNPPRIWLQASTATIYAHRFDAPNDEESGIIGGSEPGTPYLWRKSVELAQAWEAEAMAARTPQTRRALLRSAMVMSPDRGGVFYVLATLCRLGMGRHGNGRQYMSWIHDVDFVSAIDFIINRDDLAGPINLCSPNPIPNHEFIAELGTALGSR